MKTRGGPTKEILDEARDWWRGVAERSVDEVCRGLLGQGRVRRRSVAVTLVEVVRESRARSARPARTASRVFAAVAAATRDREGRGAMLGRAVARAHCTDDAAVKSLEVSHAVEALCTPEVRERVSELHRRGALRHEYDVAYAVVVLERGDRTVDQLAAELDREYAQLGHRCTRVYPPS